MAWCRSGDKPLSQPMMGSLLTHICVTRPQWFNPDNSKHGYKKNIPSIFEIMTLSFVLKKDTQIKEFEKLWNFEKYMTLSNKLNILHFNRDIGSQVFDNIAGATWSYSWFLVATTYRQTSNTRRTKSKNRNVYRLFLQLSLPNPLKPGVKSIMKM